MWDSPYGVAPPRKSKQETGSYVARI
jgi:hypothetical protein